MAARRGQGGIEGAWDTHLHDGSKNMMSLKIMMTFMMQLMMSLMMSLLMSLLMSLMMYK